MFETGEFNISPNALEGVVALSTGDSIYVAPSMTADPAERHDDDPIRRIFGNLGRPGLTLLTMPPTLNLRTSDPTLWRSINHVDFDGTLEDNFGGTSPHISYTGFDFPVDVGARGLRDSLANLVESIVSVNDRGEHLGEVDLRSLHNKPESLEIADFTHAGMESDDRAVSAGPGEILTIDSWAELLDPPGSTGIVRASGNWQPRLAIVAASV